MLGARPEIGVIDAEVCRRGQSVPSVRDPVLGDPPLDGLGINGEPLAQLRPVMTGGAEVMDTLFDLPAETG